MNLIAEVCMGFGLISVVALGIFTALPARYWPMRRNWEKKCLVGYHAVCPLAPLSTTVVFIFAAFLFWYGFLLR